ncbi:hypothetical protein DO97_09995 [Neosynechococcus sphagnicola sy1]|uniref:Uncharacterized protein n=1 Tax=Neosynechococcus sphagnicola sy1 TaxID=1497020 RepID=A0A098TSJ9_9CYAN|nr:hypothetical protein DO97_09995 [Neosynechococcus sphagnicola sy1]
MLGRDRTSSKVRTDAVGERENKGAAQQERTASRTMLSLDSYQLIPVLKIMSIQIHLSFLKWKRVDRSFAELVSGIEERIVALILQGVLWQNHTLSTGSCNQYEQARLSTRSGRL